MRRRTNGQPIAGALACNCTSSRTYSSGSASGIVASSCATFISGPLMPPERRLQIGRMPLAVDRHAEIALGPQPRPEPRHRAADPHIAPDPAGKTVLVGHFT